MDLLTANDRQGEYPSSYYASQVDFLPLMDAAKGTLKCDVCLIGAGFTGLSSAYHLAKRGFDVILLDAQRVGFGASGRNGGQLGTGQRVDQDELEAIVGKSHARELWDLSLQSIKLVRDLAHEMNVPVADGIIHADHKKRYVKHSFDYAGKMQREYNHDSIRALDKSEISDLINSNAYYGGTIDTAAAHINPLAFAIGLAGKAKAAGVRIFEQSKVLGITEDSPAIVSTEHAKITADHVVIGCNGYLGDLNKKVAARVMPINNYILATEPMTAAQQENLIKNNHAVADSKFVVNYFRFSDDHRLLFGGTESYGYRFPADIGAAVRKPMLEIFPQLKDIKIDYAWGGTLGITMNRLPHFERLTGNIISLSGYSGHGVALATLAGQIASEAIAGQAERFDMMANVPTLRFPGGPKLRSPLLVLAMIWYSLRDKI